jgi:hypothetical protein
MTRCFVAITAVAVAGVLLSGGQDNMIFQCQDLKNAGVELVPVTSPDYDALFKDIQQRIDNPPAGPSIPERLRRMMFGRISPDKRSTSAILLNKSAKSIAATALVWRYEEEGGRRYDHSFTNIFGRAVLLPFSNPGPSTKVQAYWFTILPGSKRYLGEGEMAGDNTDVRLPGPDEIMTGGGGIGNGAGRSQLRAIKSVTLILDGVFFTDGTFAGPNSLGLWETVTMEAKARSDVAKIARDGKDRGGTAGDILNQIGKLTGPPTGRPPAPPSPGPLDTDRVSSESQRAQQLLANEIERLRQSLGDQGTVDKLGAQADLALPEFRKI